MNGPLRVLMIEDSEDDALLLMRELERSGYEPIYKRVETAEALKIEFEKGACDVILSDHTMPNFSSTEALALYMEMGLDIPFIIVSGTMGEDAAVAAMKAGAHDYFVKGRLGRLCSAIERELREAEVRRERRLVEKELLRAHEELQRAYAELKEVDQVRSDIINNVSHELRTPLAIAKGMMELAMDEEDKVERNRLLTMGRNALLRQNEIIENLITLSGLRRGEYKLNMEDVELEPVVMLSKKMIEPRAIEEGVEILAAPCEGLVVRADYNALKNVLYNILDNAVKFNKRGGKLVIEAKRESSMVEVSITDTGMGISPENLEKIFLPLQQIDSSTTRSHGGTGTGLAVVKELIGAMGGQVRVESELGEGSCFTFTLPSPCGRDIRWAGRSAC